MTLTLEPVVVEKIAEIETMLQPEQEAQAPSTESISIETGHASSVTNKAASTECDELLVEAAKPVPIRKGFSWNFDPLFFMVLVVSSLCVALVLSVLYVRSDRLLKKHLGDLRIETTALEARISASELITATELSDDLVATVEVVPVVSEEHIKRVIPNALDVVDNESLIAALEPLSIDEALDTSQSREIEELKSLIGKQSEQISLLANENHELRIAIEFGETESVQSLVSSEVQAEVVIREIDETAPSLDLTGSNLRSSSEGSANESKLKQSSTRVLNKSLSPLIAKDIDRDELVRLVSGGYNAYSKGDYSNAQDWYGQAIQLDPHNRDANLGVAAVAISQGKHQLAESRYRHLLSLNADDATAFSALLMLSAPDNTIEHELRALLEQESSNPARLHAVMGGFYSQSQHWLKASESYRQALSDESSLSNTADNLFNLAVSLDNQGKRDAASSYYKQALDVEGAHSFDRLAVATRLKTLQVAR